MARRRSVFLFPTTHAVMHAAQLLEASGIDHDIIPRPKGIDADCGIAVVVDCGSQAAALALLREGGREPSRVLELDQP